MAPVLLAKITCSDPGCEEELEIAVNRLLQLDGFVCECGFGFVLESVAEVAEQGGEVVSIAKRRGPAVRVEPTRRVA
jgi:hypothetical protein